MSTVSKKRVSTFITTTMLTLSTITIYPNIAGQVSKTKAALDCSTIAYESSSGNNLVPSEVPATYGDCIASNTATFSATKEFPDAIAVGYGRYQGVAWSLKRRLTVWKSSACNYAIRSEFIWSGVPNSKEGITVSTPFKGRVTVKDALRTSVTFYHQLGWELSGRADWKMPGSNTNGIVLRGTGYEKDYKDWDISNPDASKPWSQDWALAEWDKSENYVPEKSKLTLNASLYFRESYDQRSPSDATSIRPRWISYGQTVVLAKKSTGTCDTLNISSDYLRTVTEKNNICMDSLKSSSGGLSAILTIASFLPISIPAGIGIVLTVGGLFVSAAEDTASTNSCPIRQNYGAPLTLVITP